MPMLPLEAFLAHLGPLTWDDLVTGFDFGLLSPLDVQCEAMGHGPAVLALRSLEREQPLTFEARLWAACTEEAGKAPRPGSARWAKAQDRWREALLRELLEQRMTGTYLAEQVERIYEQVGCPEDMLSMLSPSLGWSKTPARVDIKALQRYLASRPMPSGYSLPTSA